MKNEIRRGLERRMDSGSHGIDGLRMVLGNVFERIEK